jgi:mannose-6-phosphate isomerase-like protein (cupin superfamily)
MSTLTTPQYTVLAPGDGLRVPSGPGRDLIFKVTGEETGGAVDYLIVEVAPRGGPPLHVHHTQDELIHAAKGRFKVQIGEETFVIEEGGFAYLLLSGAWVRHRGPVWVVEVRHRRRGGAGQVRHGADRDGGARALGGRDLRLS